MLKRFSALGYLLAYIIPASTILGFYLGGWWNYLTLGLIFLVIPVLDHSIGVDERILDESSERRLANQRIYSLILYSWAFFQLAFLGWSFYVFPTFTGFFHGLGFVLGVGLTTGAIGITVAHELGHKKSSFEQNLSKLLLMTVMYMHFFIEHNKGHHVTVGTPEDPATAERNEGFYHFWVKSVFKGYAHAWKIENQRLKRKGIPILSISNQMIQFAVLPWLFCFGMMGIIYLLTGAWVWLLVGFFAAQAFLAFTLLESVNYVEHYGLKREKLQNGRYEPVSEIHSWNSSYVLSNYFLFQLQLHTDHHLYAIKRYQTLQHIDNAPQLPSGYPGMIITALVPPLWKRIVNPRLDDYEKAIRAHS